VLYNGDIDVIILDKAFKNRTYGLLLTKEFKIYKKNYLIKISSILFNVHVVYKKEANNTRLITVIYEISRIVFSNL
jgi:hypothetical protein